MLPAVVPRCRWLATPPLSAGGVIQLTAQRWTTWAFASPTTTVVAPAWRTHQRDGAHRGLIGDSGYYGHIVSNQGNRLLI
jgi:hypothetical protein